MNPTATAQLSERGVRLGQLRAELGWVNLLYRADANEWIRSWRQRERWIARWERGMERRITRLHSGLDVEDLVAFAQGTTEKRRWFVRKADAEEPTAEEISARIMEIIKEQAWAEGAQAFYVGLAMDTGLDAGQYTLDALGIHKTFDWTNPRDFARNMYGPRGSKIIQNLYGSHLEQLGKIVANIVQPAKPGTIQQLAHDIRAEWGKLTRAEAMRIARTEAQIVWNDMQFNTMALNGVPGYDPLLAHGPNIGTTTQPVCARCIAWAADGPWTKEDPPTRIPPIHPNCRCTLVPLFDMPDGSRWLPPKEPWVGDGVPVCSLQKSLVVKTACLKPLDPPVLASDMPYGITSTDVGDAVTVHNGVPLMMKDGSWVKVGDSIPNPVSGQIIDVDDVRRLVQVTDEAGDVTYIATDIKNVGPLRAPKKPAAVPSKAVRTPRDTTPLPPVDGTPVSGSELRRLLDHKRSTLDREAKKALKGYSGNDFFDINRNLRAGKKGRYADQINDIDRAFRTVAPTPSPAIVYRGADLSRVRGAKKLDVGSVINDKGFMSTSASRSVADSFALSNEDDILEIVVPRGSKVLDVNRLVGSEHGEEREILLPRGTRLVVESIKDRPRKRGYNGPMGRHIRVRAVMPS